MLSVIIKSGTDMKKLLKLSVFFFLLVVVNMDSYAQDITANQIIEQSDKIRNPSGSYKMDANITVYENGVVKDEMEVTIHSKPDEDSGMYRTLVEIIKPKKDRAKLILRNSQDLWFFDPSSKASVRISPQQRLLGQVSNGDVMSSNFALDYESNLIGEEQIRDSSKKLQDCYHVKLKAINEKVTYPLIEYWVSKGNFHPIKGKFYTESGRLLKVAYYRSFKPVLGVNRPTQVLIIDSLDTKKITKMSFSDFSEAEIPDYWFQRNWLPRHGNR